MSDTYTNTAGDETAVERTGATDAIISHDTATTAPANGTADGDHPQKKRKGKRRRAKNGDKDAKGNAKRRRNGGGTIIRRAVERRGEDGRKYVEYRWDARYYVRVDGVLKRKSKTLEARTVEEARAELEKLMDGQKEFSQERELEKAVARLAGVRADIAEALKAQAEEAARRKADDDERRAVAIADAWPLYEKSAKRPDSGARTLDGYRSQYAIFAKWCADNHPDKPKMRDVTPEMAESFIRHIEATKSRNTRNKYLIFLRTFWRVLRWNADAQLTVDPWEGIRTLTTAPDTVRRRDLTTDELARVAAFLRSEEAKPTLAYTYQPDDHRKPPQAWDLRGEMLSLVALGLYLGARLGDCCTLQWSAVDLSLGTVAYTPRKTARKYQRTVTAPVHPALARLLSSVPPENRRGYLLPMLAELYTNRDPSLITNRFQAVLRAVGIETTADAPEGEGGGTRARTSCGFHSLRHFFAAWLDNHGVNHSLTNYLTCHEQGKVEANYYHGNRAALAAAVATLPTIPTLTGDADAPNAVTDAHGDGARLTAFRAAWDALTPDERQQARAYIG